MNNCKKYFDDQKEFWDDTSEFDAQIEELKTALRADIKRETKELIEKLQKELDELKDYKARYLGLGEVDPNFHPFAEEDPVVMEKIQKNLR